MPTYYVNIPCAVTDGHPGALVAPKSIIRVAVWGHDPDDAIDRVRRALEEVIEKEGSR